MEKLNIAELLKDCPEGMELNCMLFDDVTFSGITPTRFPIRIKVNGMYKYLTKEGYFHDPLCIPQAKCIIFPKGKTTCEGFKRPFKDGDIVRYLDSIAIFNGWGDETLFRTYVVAYLHGDSTIDVAIPLFGKAIRRETNFATEEEKQKLFDAIKANGYKWNSKTKTLEKLIVPKFKVGDIVQNKDGYKVRITEVNIEDECYGYESLIANGIGGISFNEQNDWELIPNKLDINTLKPFDNEKLEENKFPSFEPMFKKNDELEYKIPDGYEITEVSKDTVFIKPIKSKYPTTFEECLNRLYCKAVLKTIVGYKAKLLFNLEMLLICRDAYWKIVGEEMGLGKPWEPRWNDNYQTKWIINFYQDEINLTNGPNMHFVLVFPTVEMRNAFYDNFKDLIESCKELL